MAKLKPCPFCGVPPTVRKGMLGGYVLEHAAVSAEKCILARLRDSILATSESPEAIGYGWNQRAGDNRTDPLGEALNSGDGSYKP